MKARNRIAVLQCHASTATRNMLRPHSFDVIVADGVSDDTTLAWYSTPSVDPLGPPAIARDRLSGLLVVAARDEASSSAIASREAFNRCDPFGVMWSSTTQILLDNLTDPSSRWTYARQLTHVDVALVLGIRSDLEGGSAAVLVRRLAHERLSACMPIVAGVEASDRLHAIHALQNVLGATIAAGVRRCWQPGMHDDGGPAE